MSILIVNRMPRNAYCFRFRCREHFLWGEQMRSREELVKGREGAVRRSEVEYEQKLYNEISKYVCLCNNSCTTFAVFLILQSPCQVVRLMIDLHKMCASLCSRFKLEEQARYLERTKGLEVRECRVQGA